MTPGEQNFKEQIDFLLNQYANGSLDIHQTMQLIGMAYGDYLEFHPEEWPNIYDRHELEKAVRATGATFPGQERRGDSEPAGS
jgi:hypothetical protein